MVNNERVDISIVIPALDEEKYIKSCLESILHLNTKLNFEVILVDNNCIDATVSIANSFQGKINLRIIKEENPGRGAARSKGFKVARGEIIVSTDADTIVYDSWLETLVDSLNDQVIAVTTSSKIIDSSFLTNLIFNFIQPMMTIVYGFFFGNSWLFGFSFAIYKSIYEKSGGFDIKLQAQEDFDLGYRVSKLGRIKFINKPVLFSGRRFKKGFLRGLYTYAVTFIQAFVFKKKDIYLGNPR